MDFNRFARQRNGERFRNGLDDERRKGKMTIWRFKAADHGDILCEDFWTTPEGAQESRDKFIAQHPQEASCCAMSIREIHVDCPDARDE